MALARAVHPAACVAPMLWAQIVGMLVLLIAVSYLVQWLMPRNKSQAIARRRYLRWDVAPLVAFVGAVLLVLSFAQAVEGDAIAMWGWGILLGLIVNAGAWLLGVYRPNPVTGKRLGLVQTVRRYGPPMNKPIAEEKNDH